MSELKLLSLGKTSGGNIKKGQNQLFPENQVEIYKDINYIQKIRGLQDPPVCYVCAYQHHWREVALSSKII